MENYLPTVWAALQDRLIVLAIVMALDFVLGVIVALVLHEFDWQKLNHYLISDFLPIMGWVVVVFLVNLPPALLPDKKPIPIFSDVIYGTVFLTMLGSVLLTLTKIGILKSQLAALHIPYMAKK